MIVHSSDAVVVAQRFGCVFTLSFRQAVHDAACICIFRLNKAGDISQRVLRLWPDLVAQVGAIERLGEDDTVSDAQVGDDVLLDALVGCCRQSNDRHSRIFDLQIAERLVIGS